MIKLSSLLVSKKGSKQNADPQEYLRRLTHLYLQNKAIIEIEDLPICKKVIVLYLQNNLIEKVDNLHQLKRLTHLYLQNNKIKSMKDFENLKNLKKLYLGNNCISTVEGIEQLKNLEELHLEKQKLSPDEILTFDPQSIAALKVSLQVLTVTGNGIKTLSPLSSLEALQCLKIGYNQLEEMSELLSALQTWTQLRQLVLTGNRICFQQRYRETVIAVSYHALEDLDGKQILPVTRSFLQSLALRQASRHIQPCTAKRAVAHDQDGASRNQSLQLAINSQHCARLPDIPPDSEPFLSSLFPAWKSGKPRSAKPQTPEHLLNNWPISSAKLTRRKSCSSTSTDLSHHLHISRL